MLTLFQKPPRASQYLMLCAIACMVRMLTFYGYIQYETRYQQPDSMDYHLGGWCLNQEVGFRKPDGRPCFWRTPGYPYFLSFFYDRKNRDLRFEQHTATHRAALLAQIILCSALPVCAGLLAQVLTASPPVIWITALIATVHTGYVLASTYLLTDGLAALLFMLFLICLFAMLRFTGELPFSKTLQPIRRPSIRPTGTRDERLLCTGPCIERHPYALLIAAALFLSAYTWMRPMGQFIGILTTLLLLFSAGTWRSSCMRALCFFMFLSMTLMPWFMRNHRWTGSYFFCPLFGLYLNVFNAPKILVRIYNIPLQEAHARLSRDAHLIILKEHEKLQREKSNKVVCGENLCLRTAWPIIAAHPFYFIYDWITEVIKTTYDLYAYQLVALANNCFAWDPLVEYLPEKIYDTLYGKPMPYLFRFLAWIEIAYACIIWSGIFAGCWFFLIYPWISGEKHLFFSYGLLWLKCGIFIGTVVAQTGGFGYARLRLPIELLMIILGVMFWLWLYQKRN